MSTLVLDKGVCGLHTFELPDSDVWRNVGRAGHGSTHDDSDHQGRSTRYTTLTARVGMRMGIVLVSGGEASGKVFHASD